MTRKKDIKRIYPTAPVEPNVGAVYAKINEVVDAINELRKQTEAQKTTYNVATGEMEAPTIKCPMCGGGTLVYDEGVEEWYCDKCRLYADKDVWCALINATNKK